VDSKSKTNTRQDRHRTSIPEGEYRGLLISQQIGISRKGTLQLELKYKIVALSITRNVYLYITPRAIQRTKHTLAMLGFTAADVGQLFLCEELRADLQHSECILRCDMEDFQGRPSEQWSIIRGDDTPPTHEVTPIPRPLSPSPQSTSGAVQPQVAKQTPCNQLPMAQLSHLQSAPTPSRQLPPPATGTPTAAHRPAGTPYNWNSPVRQTPQSSAPSTSSTQRPDSETGVV